MEKQKPLQFKKHVIDEHPAGSKNDICLVGDIDNDGNQDIVIGGLEGEDNLVWYRYPDWKRFVIGSAPLEAGGVLHDLTGNGRLDVIAGEMKDCHLYWWENPDDPAGRWTRRVIDNRISGNYHDQLFCDIDGDGEDELVIVSKRDDVGVYFDIPDDPRQEPWPDEQRHVFYNGYKLEGLAFADLNGDGKSELAVGNGYFLPLLKDNNAGTVWERHTFIEKWAAARIAVSDFNNDGNLDVVLSEAESIPARLAWFEGPDWNMHVLEENLSNLHSLEIDDFNGNGHSDIFVGEMNLNKTERPTLRFYLGDGKGNFQAQIFDNPIGTHESKLIRLGSSKLPSIVVKPYHPFNRIELWENVT